MILVILVLLLLTIILLYHFYTNTPLIETMDINTAINSNDEDDNKYDNLQSTNPLFIAIKNAANIATLQTEVNTLNTLKDKLSNITKQVQENSKILFNIDKQISDMASSTIGGKPPEGKPLPTLTGLH